MAVNRPQADAVIAYPARVPGRKTRYGLPPLGPLSMTSVLNQAGLIGRVIDGEIEGLFPNQVADRIAKFKPTVVGISAMTPQVLSAFALAERVKTLMPESFVVFGGAHVNSTGHGDIHHCPSIDAALLGEGERSFAELTRRILNQSPLDDLPGLLLQGQDPADIKPPDRIEDLEMLPPVDYTLVDYRRYRMHYTDKRYILCTIAGRGCPYSCSFCDAWRTHGRRLRLRNPEKLARELKEQVDCHGFEFIAFKDSTFTANRQWVMELCDALRAFGPHVHFSCNTRVDRVDEELLSNMKAAGLRYVLFGVESACPEILERIGKGTAPEQAVNAHRLAAKVGLTVHSTYLLGNPGETDDQAKQTIDFACSLPGWTAAFNYAVAFPGTRLYSEGIEQGRVKPDWWLLKDQTRRRWIDESAGMVQCDYDVKKSLRKAYLRYYMRPRFILRAVAMVSAHPKMGLHLLRLGWVFFRFSMIRRWRINR